MGNTLSHDQAAGFARGRAAVRMLGARRPSGAMTPLTRNTGEFAAAQPSTPKAVVAVAQRAVGMKKYQDKTRICAASGGESGSHPAWDPV